MHNVYERLKNAAHEAGLEVVETKDLNVYDGGVNVGQVFADYMHEKGVRGLIYMETVYVNSALTVEEKSHVLAHEIGHHFIHKGYRLVESITQGTRGQREAVEAQADAFARWLLVCFTKIP